VYSPATSKTDPRVNTLRLLFRHLLAFRSLYECEGISEIISPDGVTWSLFDLEYLYKAAMRRPTGIKDYDREHPTLPIRQQQAIELFLVLNMPEERAAVTMELSPTNPVGMYATQGLTRLLRMMDTGYLKRFADTDRMLSVA
jgi:hypothetical protein